jgi:DNA-binding response OmpR family regulator
MTKILVVDDDPMPVALLRALFELDKYELIHAPNAIEGLKMAAAEMPQLIVTDMMMPQMSGLEFVSAAKADARIKHIPVIVSSARKSVEDAHLCLKAGAIEYIPKPLDLIQFRKKVKAILGHA